ncbi:MAG TPA: hypothetical protein VHY84_07230 [Bryobacteraceae bacterium]|jgi:hypothetical protein|nr:hypothetical protein [Bryobacteraceae bacterium]
MASISLGLINRGEQPFQDGKVDTFVLESKREMRAEFSGGGMSGSQDAPPGFTSHVVPFADRRKNIWQRDAQVIGGDDRGVPNRGAPFG